MADRVVEALFAACWASPSNDEPRLVLGDALLERGDPRGELIALQGRRHGKTPSAAERALVKEHGDAWLGRLQPWLRAPRFHLGLVEAAAVKGGKWNLGAAIDWPEWSTLREVDARGIASSQTSSLLSARALNPTGLNGVSVVVLRNLFAARGPLPLVSLRGVSPFAEEDGAYDWDVLAAWSREEPAALPRLRHLSLGGSSMVTFNENAYAELLDSPIARQIESLSLDVEPASVGAVVSRAPANITRLECRFGSQSVLIDPAARTITGAPDLLGQVVLNGFRRVVVNRRSSYRAP